MRGAHAEPFDALTYVDTGPVQERVYAQYAGLGWIGKNTCLINPELGSWLFLGVVITSLALEPTRKGWSSAAAARSAWRPCPTAALVEPGVLDSTRCLSYLTIELRGEIPEALAARGRHARLRVRHLPGRSVPTTGQPRSRRIRPGSRGRALDHVTLADLWSRSDTDLRGPSRGTPMTRAKVAGVRRNTAVALGNAGGVGSADSTRPARTARRSRPTAFRSHVRWARARLL
jgi:epoxyqueuosine reductase